MRFSVLSSGSKANATFLESGSTRILIDCGLSAREAERRLRSLGVDPATLSGILITHEHSDHITGVPVFSRRFKLPVYVNEATSEFLGPVDRLEQICTGEQFEIGSLTIAPFRIVHDAVDPVGFVVRSEGLRFVQATDLGKVTPLVKDALSFAHAMVLESNHDEDMLRECNYPWVLKQRIASTHGHLSNSAAATALSDAMHGELMHVVLAHLSENSNTPDQALSTVRQGAATGSLLSLEAASIAGPTALIEIGERVLEVA